jgi:hypothetical protein
MDPRLNDMRNKGEYNYGEQDGTRRPNMPGVYYHEGADKFIETGGVKLPDGRTVHESASGKIQADAFRQMGFRPATAEEQAAYDAAQKAAARIKRINKTRTTTVISGGR